MKLLTTHLDTRRWQGAFARLAMILVVKRARESVRDR
jgi:hypothetical protein